MAAAVSAVGDGDGGDGAICVGGNWGNSCCWLAMAATINGWWEVVVAESIVSASGGSDRHGGSVGSDGRQR